MNKLDSKYSLELVNQNGELLADLTGRAGNRKVTISRNESEDIQWSIDLNEFEHYCGLLKVIPSTLLVPGQTEVRVRRGQKYLAGGQLIYREVGISPSEQAVSLRATGFLSLFKDRFTAAERIFMATQATTIARTLIDESQALSNGNFGITIGSLATVGVHDRTYRDTNIKEALQALTKVQTAPFDFEFTYNKVFNTYTQLGSQRPDIVFEYPGNIKSLSVPNDATGIANQVTAKGSGFGDLGAVRVTVDDAGSQPNYKLRQKIITPNSVQETDELTDHAQAELAAWAFPFEIPGVKVDGNIPPYVTDYKVGDFVRAKLSGYQMIEHINTMYRIEKLVLEVDENDNETVSLYWST